jgi:hypothetical protein
MKKTLRLIALAGVLAMSWPLSDRPSYAISPCSEVHGQPCTICCARCLNEGLVKVCICEDDVYNCHI